MKKKMEQPHPAEHAVYLVSLGCSKNLVDTEVIAGSLLTAGYLLAFDPEEADLYLINSCAFIPAARAEADEPRARSDRGGRTRSAQKGGGAARRAERGTKRPGASAAYH